MAGGYCRVFWVSGHSIKWWQFLTVQSSLIVRSSISDLKTKTQFCVSGRLRRAVFRTMASVAGLTMLCEQTRTWVILPCCGLRQIDL